MMSAHNHRHLQESLMFLMTTKSNQKFSVNAKHYNEKSHLLFFSKQNKNQEMKNLKAIYRLSNAAG